jgi:hypothetical protein
MRPSRFPKVNDVMLAEALRQLLPVASHGMASTSVTNHRRVVMRAENVLDYWTRQERGRIKQLGGPLPKIEYPAYTPVATDVDDPGQVIPVECQRPPRPKKRRPGRDTPGID